MPDIDLVDQDAYASGGVPHEQLAWLRRHEPVYWHHGEPERGYPGFWAITRHEDVTYVSRHPELFSSHTRLALFDEAPPEHVAMQQMMMLNQDPPDHTRKRGFVNRGFTPRAIGLLAEHVRDIARQLVAEVGPGADFVHDIAAPLPLYVICELLGAPVEDREKIFNWSNKMIGFDDPEFQLTPEDGQEAAAQIYAYAHELAAERAGSPRDDIVTKLLEPDGKGDRLSTDEFDLFVLLLMVAGNETTRNAASGGMQAFFDHPGEWQRLLADRSLTRTAVDEIVRWVTPVNLFRRTATQDVELRGQKIREGDKVVVFYSSANRDEAVFTDPGVFDIGRDPNPHLGFGGGGPHFCLGAHLARLELMVLFETLADLLPDIAPSGPARRLRSNFINGIKSLPLR
ncbi:cytochrome P450 [Actinocorallia longicatena]|uniref:Cytochrome P450 n=1 Tax=Actinocorallia longicatena TaxID=111803 RepID=A0ABP6QA83_9ACTN